MQPNRSAFDRGIGEFVEWAYKGGASNRTTGFGYTYGSKSWWVRISGCEEKELVEEYVPPLEHPVANVGH